MEPDRGEVRVEQGGEHALVELRRGHAFAEVPRDDARDERDQAPERILLAQTGEKEKRRDEIHALHVPHHRVVRRVRRQDVTERIPHREA